MGVTVKVFSLVGRTRAALAVATTCPLPAGTVGVAYSAAFAGSGGTAPYTFTISAGALPAGLSLAGGVVSGTPTLSGTAAFTIQITDANGATATKSCSLVIADFSFADSFQRADQPFLAGTNWTMTPIPSNANTVSGTQYANAVNVSGGVQLRLSNPTGGSIVPAIYLQPRLSANLNGVDQYAQLAFVANSGFGRGGPCVFQDPNGDTCYSLIFVPDLAPKQWILARVTSAGATTLIGVDPARTIAANDVMKVRVTVTAGVPTLTVSKNGVDVTGGSFVDNSGSQLLTGQPGIYWQGNSAGINVDVNLFQCGTGAGP